MTNWRIRNGLLVISSLMLFLFALVMVFLVQEALSDTRLGDAAQPVHFAASQVSQNSLSLERDLRDALINDPPFSGSAQESTAPLSPPASVTVAPEQKPALAEIQPARSPSVPAPQSSIPEVNARGYSMDQMGNINIVGIDGVIRTFDGSKPIKLIFPPEYGVPPMVVGGVRLVPPPPSAASQLPEVAVRGYSVDPSGSINIIGMDGVMRTLDGSKQVRLVFPPEYGVPPQIVGGGALPPSDENQTQTAATRQVLFTQSAPAPSKDSDSTTDLMQDGVNAVMKRMLKGRK